MIEIIVDECYKIGLLLQQVKTCENVIMYIFNETQFKCIDVGMNEPATADLQNMIIVNRCPN